MKAGATAAVLLAAVMTTGCMNQNVKQVYHTPDARRLVIEGDYGLVQNAVLVKVDGAEATRVPLWGEGSSERHHGKLDGRDVGAECSTSMWTDGAVRCDVYVDGVWATRLTFDEHVTDTVVIYQPPARW